MQNDNYIREQEIIEKTEMENDYKNKRRIKSC